MAAAECCSSSPVAQPPIILPSLTHDSAYLVASSSPERNNERLSMTLELSSRGLKKHPHSTVAALGLIGTLPAVAACSSDSSGVGTSSAGHAGGTAVTGSSGTGGTGIGGAGVSAAGSGGRPLATAGANASGATGGGGTGGGALATGGANASGGTGGGSTGGGGNSGGGAQSGAAGGGAGGVGSVGALETVSVPAGGAVTPSRMSLANGALFLLKASGSLKAGTGADAQYGDMDAEYGGITAAGTGQDSVASVDVGLDVGFKVERGTPGRKKWFGPYRGDHTYYVIVTGAGAPLSLKTLQPPQSTATGAFTVSIFPLSATATPTVMLDSLGAPLTPLIVNSSITTASSTVYLLKVAGEGKVGPTPAALGDADYMDYDPNGTTKVDVGDNNVDYGLGVDEFDTHVTPRRNWWGPWRKDHTYYMLFAGTGKKIGFMYYDTGYGDNSPDYMLALQILPVP
jgi:hypothetical protein